jgi:hypothetical protein
MNKVRRGTAVKGLKGFFENLFADDKGVGADSADCARPAPTVPEPTYKKVILLVASMRCTG